MPELAGSDSRERRSARFHGLASETRDEGRNQGTSCLLGWFVQEKREEARELVTKWNCFNPTASKVILSFVLVQLTWDAVANQNSANCNTCIVPRPAAVLPQAVVIL
ncbi:hypothetical protein DFH06DRAFT_1136242 [Mycena polygramma]|nr:hypothetical protein DFH06DRAFT_1136242 [Mycena polygramma]